MIPVYLFGFFIPVSPELLAVLIYFATGNLQRPIIELLTSASNKYFTAIVQQYKQHFSDDKYSQDEECSCHIKFI